MTGIRERVKALTPPVLKGLLRGIEKEGLRIRADGSLADTPHPPGLGSALTHPREHRCGQRGEPFLQCRQSSSRGLAAGCV